MPRVATVDNEHISFASSRKPSEFQPPRTIPVCHALSRNQSWETTSRQLYRLRTICTKALSVQMILVRNAAGSIGCAWITTACYSLGNLFLGKPSYLQSRDDLVVANSVWAAIAFCTVVFISYAPLMLSLRFLHAPYEPPSLWFCLFRLAKATFVYFFVAIIAVLGFGYSVAYLAQVEPATFNYKIESYADNLSLLIYFTGITREVKNIYYQETCQGRDKLQNKRKRSRNTVTPQPDVHVASAPSRYRPSVFWKAYLKRLPSCGAPLLATGFVHILSRQRLVERGSLTMSMVFISGTAFKLFIQEMVKLYVIKKRVRSTRVMCVVVGVPTVLIDTQMRMLLTGSINTQTVTKGVLGMAMIEISFRFVKAKLLQWTIYKREHTILSRNRGLSINLRQPRPSLSSSHVDFEMWRRQVQAFHTVEINADMYAEYIAIGCSFSILFFFGSHPHYSLLRQSQTTSAIVNLSTWRMNQLYLLGFQLGVEIIVDYISIVLEMATGLGFDHIKGLGSFLAVLFMVTAVMNITISIGVYLS